MPIPKTLANAEGSWKGTSKLNKAWLPEDEQVVTSDSTLSVYFDGAKSHAAIAYKWQEDGDQFGTCVLCGSDTSGIVTAGWTDSWHQNTGVMHLSGSGMLDGPVKLTGSYSVEGHPDWGWRLELETQGENELLLRMVNISPEGEETWAVDAHYTRA